MPCMAMRLDTPPLMKSLIDACRPNGGAAMRSHLKMRFLSDVILCTAFAFTYTPMTTMALNGIRPMLVSICHGAWIEEYSKP